MSQLVLDLTKIYHHKNKISFTIRKSLGYTYVLNFKLLVLGTQYITISIVIHAIKESHISEKKNWKK